VNEAWLAGFASGFIACIIVVAVSLVIASKIRWNDKENDDDGGVHR